LWAYNVSSSVKNKHTNRGGPEGVHVDYLSEQLNIDNGTTRYTTSHNSWNLQTLLVRTSYEQKIQCYKHAFSTLQEGTGGTCYRWGGVHHCWYRPFCADLGPSALMVLDGRSHKSSSVGVSCIARLAQLCFNKPFSQPQHFLVTNNFWTRTNLQSW
jgi:hypothetical protein